MGAPSPPTLGGCARAHESRDTPARGHPQPHTHSGLYSRQGYLNSRLLGRSAGDTTKPKVLLGNGGRLCEKYKWRRGDFSCASRIYHWGCRGVQGVRYVTEGVEVGNTTRSNSRRSIRASMSPRSTQFAPDPLPTRIKCENAFMRAHTCVCVCVCVRACLCVAVVAAVRCGCLRPWQESHTRTCLTPRTLQHTH